MTEQRLIEGVRVTPLRRILNEKGDVFHAMKASEQDFEKFGEAYFTTVHKGTTKGWKQHHRMRLNLVVPIGEVRFDVRSADGATAMSVVVGESNYARLSIDPGHWVAFTGQGDFNLVLNLASLEHDPDEATDVPLETYALDRTQ